jgi:dTMP kinase
VHGQLQPDLTFLFDLPPALAGERIAAQRRQLDRFEQEPADFHQRVRHAYLERAAAAPQRIQIINADQDLEEVNKQVEKIVVIHCL